VAHPLVRAHPRTGRPALWLSSLYTDGVVGVSRRRGALLLALFTEALLDPAVQLRWRWEAGDVVVWDETSTSHRALGDHAPQHRRMRRCTVAGERPHG
jgi:taurine dioxygenase